MARVTVSPEKVTLVYSSRSSTGRGVYALWTISRLARILGSFWASSLSTRTPTPLPIIRR